MIPEAAVNTIDRVFNAISLVCPIEGCYHRNQLILPNTGLGGELIITYAGICLPCLYDTVKDILTVIPLIQRQIKFL